MEVILLERVEYLGQMGEVVRVKPGYARNFLLPRGKAVRATQANRARFEEQRVQLEAANLQRKVEAEAVGEKLDGLSVTLIRQAGEAGQLYGSVSARDLAEAVTAAGFTIERSQVRLTTPIKALGLHKVSVALHPEVVVGVVVNVARSPDEAAIQAATGGAVTRGRDEVDEEAEDQFSEAAEEADEIPAFDSLRAPDEA